jgi:hypothetical protein
LSLKYDFLSDAQPYQELKPMPTIMYNCKRCKVGKRVEYTLGDMRHGFYRLAADGVTRIHAGIHIQRIGGGKPTEYGGDIENGVCKCCGKMMAYDVLKGRLNAAIKCNAKCQASRGPQCDCSCAGANHGKSWA